MTQEAPAMPPVPPSPLERLVAALLEPGREAEEAAGRALRNSLGQDPVSTLRAAVEACRGAKRAARPGLPFEERAALVLRDGMALSWAEAAQAAGATPEGFAGHLGRGRLRTAGRDDAGIHSVPDLCLFMDRELDEKNLKRVRDHLESCATCNGAYGKMADGARAARARILPLPSEGWAASALSNLEERERIQAARRLKRDTLLALPFDPPLGLYINGALAAILLLTAILGRSGLSAILGWFTPDSPEAAGLLDGVTIIRK